MKKTLDLEYMKAAVLKVKTGLRAGPKGGNGKGNGKPGDIVMKYGIVALYAAVFP